MKNSSERPYPPSWVDRLTDWIERLPIPAWAFYLILYLVAAISLNLASWLNGFLPWGQPSLAQIYNGIWLPAGLFVIHHTDRVALQALDRFSSLVDGKDRELAAIRYRMTTMPARPAFWIWAIVALILLAGVIQDPSFVIYEWSDGPIHPLTWLISALFGILSYGMAPLMIYHAIRQLNLVTKAYELLDKVNVFHQQPLYAFSGLTMRTALLLVGQVYITYAGEAIYSLSSLEETVNLALSIVVVPASLAIVLLPLLGIHQRLVDAKISVLEENSVQIAGTRDKLYRAIDQQAYDDINGMEAAMSSLYKEREQLKSIPTWPWAAGALRNFLSAVLIPMLLWLLQTVAERFF